MQAVSSVTVAAMDGVLASLDKLTKKQRTTLNVEEKLEETLTELQQWKRAPTQHGLDELKQRLELLMKATREQTQARGKELQSAASKLGKAVDKAAAPHLDKSIPAIPVDESLVMEAVAQHLLFAGLPQVAQQMLDDGAVGQRCAELVAPFEDVHRVEKAIEAQDLQPALDWISKHKLQLSARGSPLATMVGSLWFTQLLSRGRVAEALTFIRTQMQPEAMGATKEAAACTGEGAVAAATAAAEVAETAETAARAAAGCEKVPPRAITPRPQLSAQQQLRRLMGSLAFAGRLADSPYADMLEGSLWEAVAARFKEDAHALLGLPPTSPLASCVEAGARALPTLLKFSALLDAKYEETWRTSKQLPVELPAAAEAECHHSIFTCPVSKESTTPDNPPMLLPCGHVLSLGSIVKLARGLRTVRFKCPYCPVESTAAMAKALHL